MGAIRLDQDKLCLMQENRQISFFPNARWNGQTNDNLDDIYTQKSMSISRYTQSATLTNILARQPTNDTNQQLLFGMIGRSLSDFSEARRTCIQLAQHQHWHRLWETTRDVNTLQKPIINYRRGGATALVEDLEGMFRSTNCNNHIRMALSTTKAIAGRSTNDPPKGFVVPKFTMYDGMSDPFDHIMHVRQLMILNIGNDALMCKIFKQSISSSTPFLEPTTMDNLFRRADKYTMLEDDVQVASQQVLMRHETVVPALVSSTGPRVVINCIHGGSIDEKHSSRQQRQRQMGYSPSALENLGRLLSRFNGATTTSLGNVVLPVQADPITLSMQFSMVDDLSPYNAIMECA
ncbi:hypothetical protein AAG906_020273 [Vitis piasezkii]